MAARAQGKASQGPDTNPASPLLNHHSVLASSSPKGKSFPLSGPSPAKCESASNAPPQSQTHQSPLADTGDTHAGLAAATSTAKAAASPLSSCSNSPSSVRINQNYNPNSGAAPPASHAPKAVPPNDNECENDLILGNANRDAVFGHGADDRAADGRAHREADLDSADDADSRPLLESTNANGVVAAGKRANGKYGCDSAADESNETEKLINNGDSA